MDGIANDHNYEDEEDVRPTAEGLVDEEEANSDDEMD